MILPSIQVQKAPIVAGQVEAADGFRYSWSLTGDSNRDQFLEQIWTTGTRDQPVHGGERGIGLDVSLGASARQRLAGLRASNSKLAGDVDRTGEDRVLVKVSPDIPYGDVYPIVMALHDMGAGGIDLGSEELKE